MAGVVGGTGRGVVLAVAHAGEGALVPRSGMADGSRKGLAS